jgi:microcystin-dependent protein
MSGLIGAVFFHGGDTPPDGAIACNNQILAQASYPDLYAAIGDTWNLFNGDDPGAGNFRAPPSEVGGLPLYPCAHNAGVDNVGDFLPAQNKNHGHGGSTDSQGNHTHTVDIKRDNSARSGWGASWSKWYAGTYTRSESLQSAGSHSHTGTINQAGDEFRPQSVVALLCIWTG